jgi:hypothetical protein
MQDTTYNETSDYSHHDPMAGSAHSALANDTITYEVTDQSYDDVMFGLENAILDIGLVISEHNHVGDMLERTKADLGQPKQYMPTQMFSDFVRPPYRVLRC